MSPASWGIKLKSQSICLFPQHYSSHVLTAVSDATVKNQWLRFCLELLCSLSIKLYHFPSLASAFPQIVSLVGVLSFSPLYHHLYLFYFLNQSHAVRDDWKIVFPSHGKYWYVVFILKSKPNTHQTNKYLSAMIDSETSYVLQQDFASELFRSCTVRTPV